MLRPEIQKNMKVVIATTSQCFMKLYRFTLRQSFSKSSESNIITSSILTRYMDSKICSYLNRLASLSHSINVRMSPWRKWNQNFRKLKYIVRVYRHTSLTGPFTLRIIDRFGSSKNSTRTWVTFPVLPVLPRTLLTFASFTGWSWDARGYYGK